MIWIFCIAMSIAVFAMGCFYWSPEVGALMFMSFWLGVQYKAIDDNRK